MPDAPNSLLHFIDAAKSGGASDEFIVALLRQNGSSDKRIFQAFGNWYQERTGTAVPNGGGRMEAAKDAFFYLLAFITLGIWTIQLGRLLFTVIDGWFPNPSLDFVNPMWTARELTDELASIIVAFPVFLLVTRAIVRGVQGQPERLEGGVRKWLTYLALVIAASTMITDLVTFLAYFLRGDLSERFVLKVVTVLVIAGGVFVYYLDSLRREAGFGKRNRLFAFGGAAVVAFGIIVGFVQIGLPQTQRSTSQDARRLFDLSAVAQGIHIQWLNHRQSGFALPATIQEAQRTASVGGSIIDPVSARIYEYVPLRGTNYQLCATFARQNVSGTPVQWLHRAGHVCFSRNATEEVQILPQQW